MEVVYSVSMVVLSAVCSSIVTFHVSRSKLRKEYNHNICENIRILDFNIKILVQSMFEFNGLGKQFREVYNRVQDEFKDKKEINLNL